MDFLRNRFFRQTLLCHQELSINRNLNAESLKGLLVASSASPESEPVDLSPEKKQSFRTPAGLSFNTDFPPTKAALSVLNHHWPKAIDQDRLRQEACMKLGDCRTSDITDKDWNTVQGDLLHCYTLNIIEFHTWQAAWESKVSERPKVSRLSAYQSRKGLPIANQRHEHIVLNKIGNELIRVLDGSRDQKALRQHLKKSIEKGVLVLKQDDKSLNSPNEMEHILDQAMQQTLKRLKEAALIMG